MLPEIKAIEAQLKQILYGCVEHVQATKAALYLSASHDLNTRKYELVTSYQYNPADRKVVTANDQLVERLTVKRNPFFVNGVGADQRLAEMLFRQGNDRLLAAPLFGRGRLVGFIDMRDKAAKKPFDTPDIEAARRIGEQMLEVLASNKLFGLGGIALVEEPMHLRPSGPQQVVLPSGRVAPPNAAIQAPETGQVFSSAALKAIEAAKQYLSRRQLAAQSSKRALTEGDLDVMRMILPAALAIPHAAVASLSLVGHFSNPIATASKSTLAEDAIQVLQTHVQSWLKRLNQPHMASITNVVYPFGVLSESLAAGAMTPILSAPINPQSLEGLVLTVAFERASDEQARQGMQTFLRQLEPIVESAIVAASGRSDRQMLAERLLEPDFVKYPDLADHCRQVAMIAQRFARLLGLPASQVETVRIAALVHDVGMRLLDYERMYTKVALTDEETRGLAEHPVVGAALVEPLLGPEVAQAVLRHHERVDGKGYPSRLSGNQIPLASRIIQIADAWTAMTNRQAYQPAIPRQQATTRLREGSGTQFDPALLDRFLTNLSKIVE